MTVLGEGTRLAEEVGQDPWCCSDSNYIRREGDRESSTSRVGCGGVVPVWDLSGCEWLMIFPHGNWLWPILHWIRRTETSRRSKSGRRRDGGTSDPWNLPFPIYQKSIGLSSWVTRTSAIFFEVLSIMMQLWSNPSSFPLEHVAPGPVPAVAFTSVESSAMCGVKVPITHCQCDKALHVGSW